MDEEEGLRVALTPVQLAAILDGQFITEGETLSNHLWGGLRALGGALELLGAGALLLAPEPTGLSKIGAGVLGAHGADTLQSGVRQAWSGRSVESLTQQGTAALARRLGADAGTAQNIGIGVDIAVPLVVSLGLGAARIAAIRAGRISLIQHEAAAGSRIGGHTLARHVGKDEAFLRARLPSLPPSAPAASSFTNLDVAERVIYQALRASRADIEAWARGAARGARSRAFEFDAGQVIGSGVVRSTNALTPMTRLRFVLKLEQHNGMPYYILTAFPVP